MPIVIEGPHGLGDNIYQRGVLNVLVNECGDDVYVRTPWPELLPARVRPIRADTRLRTQAKNEAKVDAGVWYRRPANASDVRTTYGARDLEQGSILSAMARAVGVRSARMDMPGLPAWPKTERPIAVIRPVTVRTEWSNPARNPDPAALHHASRALLRTHHVIAVADIDGDAERLVGVMPEANEYFVSGELSMLALFGLCVAADVLVGGVGWLVPFALAARKRALILLGGHGGHNAPDCILGPLAPPDHSIRFVFPDEFCPCTNMRHGCPKTIALTKLDAALRELL